MSEQQEQKLPYMVSVYEAKDPPGALIFTFIPKGLQAERGPGGLPTRVPQYIVLVHQQGEDLTFNWEGSPDAPGGAQGDLGQEARKRIKVRQEWIAQVLALVTQVESWSRAINWTTKRIEKKLDDSRIGKHTVPALLLQDETVRVLLEPVSRRAPGSSGLVDLYLMPAYEDIASLYFRDGAWYLHYLFPGVKPVATLKEAEARPLSQETIALVLGEMKKHGG